MSASLSKGSSGMRPYFCSINLHISSHSAEVLVAVRTSGLCDTRPNILLKKPMSTRYAVTTRRGKNRKVRAPSQTSTTSGEGPRRMNNSQRYAKTEKEAVTANTPRSLMRRTCPSGIDTTHTAMMTSRLKAALPTIVDGPKEPEFHFSVRTSSIRLSRISGALEPRAMSVKFATVSFQALTVTHLSPLRTLRFLDVIFSMALMKMSAIMLTPRKHQKRPMR
mmetsp:Transcript_38118/g.85921  ORF Transcript_38118/g.85921 Transcript_38118/m.85921 type:complete len:221 (-) Transcript_38118:117-779(-)